MGDGGQPAHHEHDAAEGALGWLDVGFEGEVGQRPAGDGTADGPAELETKAGGGVDQAGGTIAVAELDVVGDVGEHGVLEDEQRAREQADEDLEHQRHQYCVAAEGIVKGADEG